MIERFFIVALLVSFMTTRSVISRWLPEPLKRVVRRTYQHTVPRVSDESLHSGFIADFFDSSDEYRQYADEFDTGRAARLRDAALQKYESLTGKKGLAGIGLDAARNYYSVTRNLEPEIVVETGVCNGVSTLSILLALDQNGSGTLHSIDYPFRADESLEEFRQETFEEYGGAAIPSDKNPGWIVPDELRSRWHLTIGKSQRVLPQLVTQLKEIDLFIHDSEHSHPCMMFEYELAYEWLTPGGVILSDDISWNEAFTVFTEVREPAHGRMSWNVGYIRK